MVVDVHQISGIVAEIGTQETGMQEIATATLARITQIESSST